MKHGVAFRKFSRPTAHRMLMLRNLVTSLIEHEQIKTTLPKARDAARLADKLITLGKKGDLAAARRAQGFLLKPTLIPKVFGHLATRYADRPGGYTRIHKFGNRQGDNAPHAILELVDNPKDLRFNMAARSVGWELVGSALSKGPRTVLQSGVEDVEQIIEQAVNTNEKEGSLRHRIGGKLKGLTQLNLQKALRYRGQSGLREMTMRTKTYIDRVVAEPLSHIGMRKYVEEKDKRQELVTAYEDMKKRRSFAGQRDATSGKSALSLASGSLLHRRKPALGLPAQERLEKRHSTSLQRQTPIDD